jgi:hypothetical protein
MNPTRTSALALLLSLALWLPNLHRLYGWGEQVPARTAALEKGQLTLWREEAFAQDRRTNPEWDLMARTFTGYALANQALRDPAGRAARLAALDELIDDTLAQERDHGMEHFLLPYAQASPWLEQPARSQFLDGELALLLAARRLVEEKPAYREPLRERVAAIEARMAASPSLSAESYPDECWTFCNAVALAALRASDALEGTDHGPLLQAWVAHAKAHLTDPRTGLLISAYRLDGTPTQGPEGSTIWLVAHMLQPVDPAFAQEQYQRARKELGFTFAGFGFSREWPASWGGSLDVDSGPVIPLLGASPSASGLAVLGAASFGDQPYLEALRSSLDFAAFPCESAGGLRYCAGNAVGGAVLLYASAAGPLWQRLERRAIR